MQRTTAIGLFEDRADAEEAIHALRRAGFEPEQVEAAGLRIPEADHGEEHQTVRIDETTGVLAGGAIGGVAGWLIGASAVAVPGLGALLATGALVGALGGAGIGAATGGLVGYLADYGLSHEEAHYYHERVHHGAALVIVRDDARAEEARAILHRHGAHDYHTRPAS
jgi:uncharacterized membrane protein